MTSLIIRDVSDNDAEALSVQARRAGMRREAYLRLLVEREARRAITPMATYELRFAETTELHQANGRIIRAESGIMPNTFVFNPTVPQNRAFLQARELVRRNAPGDRERAIAYLQGDWPEVYEFPVTVPPGTEQHDLGFTFRHGSQEYFVRTDGTLLVKNGKIWEPLDLPSELAEAVLDGFRQMSVEIQRLRLEIADLEQRHQR